MKDGLCCGSNDKRQGSQDDRWTETIHGHQPELLEIQFTEGEGAGPCGVGGAEL